MCEAELFVEQGESVKSKKTGQEGSRIESGKAKKSY